MSLGFSLIEKSGQQLFRGDSPVKQQLKRQSAIGVAHKKERGSVSGSRGETGQTVLLRPPANGCLRDSARNHLPVG